MVLSRSDGLYLCFLLLFMAQGQNAQSPCPKYFEYKRDDTGVYGIINLVPTRSAVRSIVLQIRFTVPTKLPSSYVGKIVLLGDKLALLQRYSRGLPIQYRVEFPITSPLPRITSLIINDEQFCNGPGDPSLPGTFITQYGLRHTLYYDEPDEEPATYQPPINVHKTDTDVDYRTIQFGKNRYSVRISGSDPKYESLLIYPNETPREPVTNSPPTTTAPTIPPTRRPETEVEPTTTARPRLTPRPRPPPGPVNNECGVTSVDSVALVYNGMNYTRGEWPWLVAIFKRKDIGLTHICSGTLISNMHVLTAAHCMRLRTSVTYMQDIVVKVGVFNIREWGDDDVTYLRTLAAVNIHESYNAFTLANDILLMTFDRPVEFNAYIKPACLWSSNVDLIHVVQSVGVVAGWGMSEVGPVGTGEPSMVRMPIVSTATCKSSKLDFHKLTSSGTFCAGDRNGAGPCLGDSGGGFYLVDQARWSVRGIVSLSLISPTKMTCDLHNYIVFTDIAQYLQWIKKGMSAKIY